jgi:excisionase family DNA binding protein
MDFETLPRDEDTDPPTEPDCFVDVGPVSPVLTVDEVAQLLRVNRKTVYELLTRGELPGGRRLGRAVRFSRDAVLDWLRQGCGSRSSRRQR